MRPSFELAITRLTIVTDLPGTWSDDRYRALLDHLDFAEAADAAAPDLLSYVTMKLQDLKAEQAARALLEFAFGDELTSGKKQNLAEAMTAERCWEECPDLEYHERLFNCQVLLNQAHGDCPQPEIQQIEAVFSATNEDAAAWLTEHCAAAPAPNLPEDLLVRCMAAALPDRAILNRLFEDQIAGAAFGEAEHILWQIRAVSLPPQGPRRIRYELTLFSPLRWTSDLEAGRTVVCEPFLVE